MIVSLALGIGASTAVFTVADAALFRPLAYDEPHELVYTRATLVADGARQRFLISPANFIEMRDRNRTFRGLSAAWFENYDLTGLEEPARIVGARITPGLYRTLGVEPVAGRFFRAEDVGSPVVLVSESLARRVLGTSVPAVGATLEVAGSGRQILGVVPDHLGYPDDVELWTPYRAEDVGPSERFGGGLSVVGRLAPGIDIPRAQQDMDRIAAHLEDLYPAVNGGRGIEVGPLRAPFVEDTRSGLVTLLAAVMIFLLATVANVTGLFLVRAGRRVRLVAMRAALGATRRSLARDAFLEGLVIAGAASVLGVAMAWFGVPALTESLTLLPPGSTPVVADPRVLAFAVTLLTFTAVTCSTAPALVASRVAPATLLREGAGATATRMERRLQNLVVVGQTILSVLLLLSAAASLDHLLSLLRVDPGFGDDPALTVRIPISEDRHPTFEERSGMVLRLARDFSEIPGVEVAGASDVLPIGDPNVGYSLSVESHPPDDPTAFEVAQGRLITPGYFEATGIRLVRGRGVSDTDRADSSPVVVVSEAFAEKYWPDADPVGMRVKRRTYDSPFPWMTVVGVVADVRDGGPANDIGATWYLPYAQHDIRFGREMSYVLRTTRSRPALLQDVRDRLERVDPMAPIIRVRSLNDLQVEALAPPRAAGRVMGGFAIGAMLLLALGTYGVMSRTVLERRRELGLRKALGASGGGVVGRVLAGSGTLLGLGLAGGLLLSPLLVDWLRWILGSELEVPGWAYPLAVALVVAVGAVASLIPAIRASQISPLVALRSE